MGRFVKIPEQEYEEAKTSMLRMINSTAVLTTRDEEILKTMMKTPELVFYLETSAGEVVGYAMLEYDISGEIVHLYTVPVYENSGIMFGVLETVAHTMEGYLTDYAINEYVDALLKLVCRTFKVAPGGKGIRNIRRIHYSITKSFYSDFVCRKIKDSQVPVEGPIDKNETILTIYSLSVSQFIWHRENVVSCEFYRTQMDYKMENKISSTDPHIVTSSVYEKQTEIDNRIEEALNQMDRIKAAKSTEKGKLGIKGFTMDSENSKCFVPGAIRFFNDAEQTYLEFEYPEFSQGRFNAKGEIATNKIQLMEEMISFLNFFKKSYQEALETIVFTYSIHNGITQWNINICMDIDGFFSVVDTSCRSQTYKIYKNFENADKIEFIRYFKDSATKFENKQLMKLCFSPADAFADRYTQDTLEYISACTQALLRVIHDQNSSKGGKKTVLFDFDGVINSYESGWIDTEIIPDPPVLGIKEVLSALKEKGWTIMIYSTRAASHAGEQAISEYLEKYGMRRYVDGITATKSIAKVLVDDRCIQFKGNESIDSLVDMVDNYETWTESIWRRRNERN